MNNKILLLLFVCCLLPLSAQESGELELMDDSDIDMLMRGDDGSASADGLDLSEIEEVDDLESLKSDVGETLFASKKDKKNKDDKKDKKNNAINFKNISKSSGDLTAPTSIFLDNLPLTKNESEIDMILQDTAIVNDDKKKFKSMVNGKNKTIIFDIGEEEKKLLEYSRFVEGKIPSKEWDEIAISAKSDKYVIQEGDWLWKISRKLFGSGFYYAKIWAINPHITNPHEIEPGMTLLFDTGSETDLPDVRFGSFDRSGTALTADIKGGKMKFSDFGRYAEPPWIREREKLIRSGTYFQYVTEETYEDLADIGQVSLNKDYENYVPPRSNIVIEEPTEEYDDTGFDRNSKIVFEYKQGFFLNTFLTSNITADLGYIKAMPDENIFVKKFGKIYVEFDDSLRPKPGDMFSVYSADGKVSHPISERVGHRYTITGQIKTVRKINELWECDVLELSSVLQRGDRVTVHTPKINKIVQTFSKRNIEGAIMGTYKNSPNASSFGDVVYLDRGRADGVEMGNVFEIYSFIDKGTGLRITSDPTYKIGEITIITLTDNFATGLVTNSSNEIPLGSLMLTKTEEKAALAMRVRKKQTLDKVKAIDGKYLDELDVELNLDDISEDLLDRADSVQLTEDELEELERQEREKSIIKGHEKDLRELNRLEAELIATENSLNEAKLDEDKFLEQQNLDLLEKKTKVKNENAFGSMNENEKDLGKKHLDQNLNNQENPYGLTEFDLEEIDELLNTESL